MNNDMNNDANIVKLMAIVAFIGLCFIIGGLILNPNKTHAPDCPCLVTVTVTE